MTSTWRRRLRRKRTLFIDCSGSTMRQRAQMWDLATTHYRGQVFGFNHFGVFSVERDVLNSMGASGVPQLIHFLAPGGFPRPLVITDEGLTPKELNALAEFGAEVVIVPVPDSTSR